MNILYKSVYALFILLLVGVAGLFLVSLLPIGGNVNIKIVKSGSMEPEIMTGSIVVVRPAASYAAGDVITFGKDTKLQIPTTHRIVEARVENGQTVYVTKGDANEEADPAVTAKNDVTGKVIFSVPYAGFVFDFARQPLGFTLMIGIPAATIILDEIIRIWQEVAKIRRRKRGVEVTSVPESSDTREPEGPVFDIPVSASSREPLDLRALRFADETRIDLSGISRRTQNEL